MLNVPMTENDACASCMQVCDGGAPDDDLWPQVHRLPGDKMGIVCMVLDARWLPACRGGHCSAESAWVHVCARMHLGHDWCDRAKGVRVTGAGVCCVRAAVRAAVMRMHVHI